MLILRSSLSRWLHGQLGLFGKLQTFRLSNPILCASSRSIPTDDTRGELVYESSNRKTVLFAKTFSLTTSLTAILLQPLLLHQLGYSPGIYVIVAASLTLAVSTPFLLHFITRNHVSHMFYNRETGKFTAYTRAMNLALKKIEFAAEDITYADSLAILSNIRVRGRPLFIVESDFYDIEPYRKIMGFDKPLRL